MRYSHIYLQGIYIDETVRRIPLLFQRLFELELRLGLFRAHPAGGDFRPMVILTKYRAAGQAAQHSNLANVRKRISNSSLKQPFRGTSEWRRGRKPLVKGFQRGKEACRSCLPTERGGIVPRFLALGERKRPVKQVAEVGQDLSRCASGRADAKLGEVRRIFLLVIDSKSLHREGLSCFLAS